MRRLVRIRWFLVLAAGCSTVQPVHEGSVYRAGRTSSDSLENAIQELQIRTVIRLNGFHPESSSYQRQSSVCERAGVRQVELTIDPRAPDRAAVTELLGALRHEPKPILLVERFPAESVGFAAALYRLAILEESKADARRELAIWQNRRLPISRLHAYDQFVYDWRGERAFYSDTAADRKADNGALYAFSFRQMIEPSSCGSVTASPQPFTNSKAPGDANDSVSAKPVRLGSPKSSPHRSRMSPSERHQG